MLARINLAPLRYHRACGPGGPIARTEWTTVDLVGTRVCQANAWLRPGLRPERPEGIYSDADGTGTAATPAVARHKAISEALERWAYDATCRTHAEEYGYHLDATSSGMAAFPGVVAGAARAAARAEAIERSCLIAWSEGRLSSRLRPTAWAGIEAVEIESPAGGSCVVVFRRTPRDFYVYGHAAAPSFAKACERALIELGRNQHVLTRALYPETERAAPRLANLFERRCVYFSTDAGHASFRRRIGPVPARQRWQPRLAVDTEVRGPWSAYAIVWRTLYAPAVPDFLRDVDDFFLW